MQEKIPEPQAAVAEAPSRVERLVRRTEWLCGLVFCAVVVINFASAAARYLGGHAFIGADEIQVYTMIWLIFVGAALVSWRQTHLRMDVFMLKLGRRSARLRDLAEALLTTAAGALMTWVSLSFVLQIKEMEQRSDGADIPMWLAHAAVVAGFSLITAIGAYRLSRLAVGQRTNP